MCVCVRHECWNSWNMSLFVDAFSTQRVVSAVYNFDSSGLSEAASLPGNATSWNYIDKKVGFDSINVNASTRALIWSTTLYGQCLSTTKQEGAATQICVTVHSRDHQMWRASACGRPNWAGGYSQGRPFEKQTLCFKRKRIHVLMWPVHHQKKKKTSRSQIESPPTRLPRYCFGVLKSAT